jgi:hypothetical protein
MPSSDTFQFPGSSYQREEMTHGVAHTCSHVSDMQLVWQSRDVIQCYCAVLFWYRTRYLALLRHCNNNIKTAAVWTQDLLMCIFYCMGWQVFEHFQHVSALTLMYHKKCASMCWGSRLKPTDLSFLDSRPILSRNVGKKLSLLAA